MKDVTRLATTVLAAGLVAGGLAGCGALHPEDFPATGPTTAATSNPQSVTSTDFGHAWPLTVDSGTVACTQNAEGDPVLTFTAPDGSVYALNSARGNEDNSDIGDITENMANAGVIRTFAFAVCDF
jgi:hypothetical protein